MLCSEIGPRKLHGWGQDKVHAMVLYIMNSFQFHSIYLENLHMSARKKTAGMSQDNISFMLNTSIKTLLLLCKYLNQAAGNLLRQIYKL
jgi:hypothetical protein